MNKKVIIYFLLFFALIIFPSNKMILGKGHGGLRVTPRNITELNNAIRIRNENSKKKRDKMSELQKMVHQNQDKFRNALENIMIMENMIGENSYEIVENASDLKESFNNTIHYEEDFLSRSKYMKFFFGQKKEIKEKFGKEIDKRKEGIKVLENLFIEAEHNRDLTEIYTKQLSDLKEEEKRMEDFYNEEIRRKGVLTWLINIFE